jgi:hypothetical protein
MLRRGLWRGFAATRHDWIVRLRGFCCIVCRHPGDLEYLQSNDRRLRNATGATVPNLNEKLRLAFLGENFATDPPMSQIDQAI